MRSNVGEYSEGNQCIYWAENLKSFFFLVVLLCGGEVSRQNIWGNVKKTEDQASSTFDGAEIEKWTFFWNRKFSSSCLGGRWTVHPNVDFLIREKKKRKEKSFPALDLPDCIQPAREAQHCNGEKSTILCCCDSCGALVTIGSYIFWHNQTIELQFSAGKSAAPFLPWVMVE